MGTRISGISNLRASKGPRGPKIIRVDDEPIGAAAHSGCTVSSRSPGGPAAAPSQIMIEFEWRIAWPLLSSFKLTVPQGGALSLHRPDTQPKGTEGGPLITVLHNDPCHIGS